jgi:hypothetical protein
MDSENMRSSNVYVVNLFLGAAIFKNGSCAYVYWAATQWTETNCAADEFGLKANTYPAKLCGLCRMQVIAFTVNFLFE